MRAFPALIPAFCLAMAGCNSSPPAPVISGTQCTEPRPQVCTMEYAPVCATRTGGARADYSSGCNACADDAVSSYEQGQCDSGGAQ
jgi:hypothetical protein